MKAITLYQPWATLMAIGAKTIETRSWSTPYRGPLAIHAGKNRSELMAFTDPEFYNPLSRAGYRVPRDLPLGAMLCIVELVECFPTGDPLAVPMSEGAFGDYSPGRFGWQTRMIEVFDTPIPCNGAMGLWEWRRP